MIAYFLGLYGNDNPYRMDYWLVAFPILYFLCLRIGSYLSTRGRSSLTLAFLPGEAAYDRTQRNTIELKMCSRESRAR